jgi:2-dehydropantoate 2-reductase
MRFAIVGAGAMGAMFGGYLAQNGQEVTLVDVDRAHVDSIIKHGLLLREHDGTERAIAVSATAEPERELGPVDVVIVLCKGWANEAAAASIRHAVEPSSWVLTVQNGLGNERRLASVLGPERIVPGTTTAGAHKLQPGIIDVSRITSTGSSITQLGPPGGGDKIPADLQHVAETLTAAGLPCEIVPDANVVIWTKLAMAASAGPLTAALGATIEAMMASPTSVTLLRGLFDEIVVVAGALGVNLDVEHVWDHAMTTYAAVGPHTTSMADDFASGRHSEIDSFCVEISYLAATHGIDTPHHDTIGRLLVAREEQGGLR